MTYRDDFPRPCKSLIYKEIKSFPQAWIYGGKLLFLYMGKLHTEKTSMATPQIFVDRSILNHLVSQKLTRIQISSILGISKKDTANLLNTYKSNTNFGVTVQQPKIRVRKRRVNRSGLTVDMVMETAKTCFSIGEVVKNLGCTRGVLDAFTIREDMKDDLKSVLRSNRSERDFKQKESKRKPKPVLNVEQVIELSKESMSMESSLLKKVNKINGTNWSYSTFLQLVKPEIDPSTGQNLLPVLKQNVAYYKSVKQIRGMIALREMKYGETK